MANKHNCPCLASAGDEETIFTLKASDLEAPIVVELWAYLRELRLGMSDKTIEAREIARQMRAERAEMERLNRKPNGQIIDSQKESYPLAPVQGERYSPIPGVKGEPWKPAPEALSLMKTEPEGDKSLPVVHITCSGPLAGTDCTRTVPRSEITLWERRVIEWLTAHSKTATFKEGKLYRIDGWDLRDAINPPPAPQMRRLSMSDAYTVAAFLNRLADGTLTPEDMPDAHLAKQPKPTPDSMPLQLDSLPKRLRSECPESIPWLLIAAFEAQAQRNHSQSLEKLARRGGLAPEEAYAVMHRIPWSREIPAAEAVAFIRQMVNGPENNAGGYPAARMAESPSFVDKRRDFGAGSEAT